MARTRFDWDPDKDAENQQKHGSHLHALNTLLLTNSVWLPETRHTVKPKSGSTVSVRLMAAS